MYILSIYDKKYIYWYNYMHSYFPFIRKHICLHRNKYIRFRQKSYFTYNNCYNSRYFNWKYNTSCTKYTDGFEFSIKYLLKLGIIFLGIRLSISDILSYGLQGLIVIIPSIFLSIIIAINIRQFFKVSNNLSMLIAVGTSICGATAIAAS